MTFTNLEKYVYSKKVLLKTTTSYFFSGDAGLIRLMELADRKKELISYAGSNYVSIILHWWMLTPRRANQSIWMFLYFSLIEIRSKN